MQLVPIFFSKCIFFPALFQSFYLVWKMTVEKNVFCFIDVSHQFSIRKAGACRGWLMPSGSIHIQFESEVALCLWEKSLSNGTALLQWCCHCFPGARLFVCCPPKTGDVGPFPHCKRCKWTGKLFCLPGKEDCIYLSHSSRKLTKTCAFTTGVHAAITWKKMPKNLNLV